MQKILKNGEGEDEENLDILMEEFPDNPKITEIIKKNNIKNSYMARPRLYSWHKVESNDKKRIFIFANNKDDNIKKNV